MDYTRLYGIFPNGRKCCTFRIIALSDYIFLLSRMVSHELPVKLDPEVMAVQDRTVMVTEMKSL